MAELRTEAVVLRIVDTGEADRILALYSREVGRLDVIARGARKSTKRFGGHLGLYARIEATVDHRPARSLQPLRGARLLAAHEGLQADLAAFAAASYLAEVVLKATHPEQADEGLWRLLCGALGALGGGDAPAGAGLEALVHVAEAGLLDALGVLPSLDACSRCGEPLDGAWVASGADGLYCDGCRPLDRRSYRVEPDALAWLRASLAAGQPLAAPAQVVQGARPLVYEGICHLLGGRPKSLDFLVEMIGA